MKKVEVVDTGRLTEKEARMNMEKMRGISGADDPEIRK